MLLVLQIQVFATGSNEFGKLGINQTVNMTTEFVEFGTENFSSIVTGASHVIAVTDKGRLYGWGSGLTNRLMAAPDHVLTPTAIEYFSSKNVTSIAAGSDHTLVIADGRVYAFGANNMQQLGGDASYMPVMPDIPETPHKVVATGYASFVLTTIGNVYFFGFCQDFICGMQSITYAKPTLMPLPTLAQDIFATTNGFIYEATNGSVYAIGDNSGYRFCEVNYTLRNFTKITGIENVKKATIGHYHTVFQIENSAFGCGVNDQKQFGSLFKQCSTPCLFAENVADVSTTELGTFVIMNETVFASGQYKFGELGASGNYTEFTSILHATNLTRLTSSYDFSFAYYELPISNAVGNPLSWWVILLICVFSVAILAVILYFLYAIFIKKEKIFISPYKRKAEKDAKIAMDMDQW